MRHLPAGKVDGALVIGDHGPRIVAVLVAGRRGQVQRLHRQIALGARGHVAAAGGEQQGERDRQKSHGNRN